MIIGLTGQSGAGKSTAAALFAKAHFEIIDCDAIVHALYETERYVGAIAAAFGEDYVADGAVDRKRLGALVFTDADALAKLNEVVRPLILEAILEKLRCVRQTGTHAVLDAPLLFEYGLDSACDVTLGVVCDREIAEARLSLRDGKSPQEIRGRLAAQHDGAYFFSHCDHILENNGDAKAFQTAFFALLDVLKADMV